MVSQRIANPSTLKGIQVRFLYAPPSKYEHVPKWLKGAGCNPVTHWFESNRVLQLMGHGVIGNVLDSDSKVIGSSPIVPANMLR